MMAIGQHFATRFRLKRYLGDRLIGGTIMASMAAIFSRLCMLVAAIAVSWFTTASGFGAFMFVYNTILVIDGLVLLGLTPAIMYFVAKHRHDNPVRAASFIAAAELVVLSIALVAGLAIVGSPAVAAMLLPGVNLSPVDAPLAAAVIVLLTLTDLKQASLQSLEAFNRSFVCALVSGPAAVILMPLGAWAGGLTGVLAGLALFAAWQYLMFTWIASREKRSRGVVGGTMLDLAVYRELFTFSMPTFAAAILWPPAIWYANRYLVGSAGSAAFGEFAIGLQWHNILLYLPMIMSLVSYVIGSSMTSSTGQTDLFRRSRRLVNMMAFPIAGFVLASPLLIRFYGTAHANALVPLIIMMITTFFASRSVILMNEIMVRRQLWRRFLINLSWTIVLVASLPFTIPGLAATGLAISYFGAHLARYLLAWFLASDRFKTA